MNVPNISQGPASAAALPRAGAGGEIAPPGTAAVAAVPVRGRPPVPAISLTRLACFDLKGDGHIDPRSVNDGGDATLLVPSHQVELPTWSYAVDSVQSSPANAAQTNRAVGAYQRYGQKPQPVPTRSPVTPPHGFGATPATPAVGTVAVVAPGAVVGVPPAGTSAPSPVPVPTPAQTPAVAAA